jgi:hypothetical protein
MAKLSGTAQCHERPNLAPDVFDPFDEFIKGKHDALGSRQSCKLVQHSGDSCKGTIQVARIDIHRGSRIGHLANIGIGAGMPVPSTATGPSQR